MKIMTTKSITLSIVTAISLLAAASSTRATPYACDLTNSGGVVSFRLNENADNVKVISSGGAVTNDLGPRVKGLTVTNLGIAGGVIKVMVSRSAPAGYTQITVDTNQVNGVYVNKYEQPRGIVVNKNPATHAFGRIYIANGQEADTASPVRTTFDGIYMLNSDDTVALDTGTTPRTAGLDFDFANAVSPMRISIGKDDNRLYITDFSDAKGGLWVTDLDVATNSIATNALDVVGDTGPTHGSVYGVVVEGTFAASNLKIYTIDEDLTPAQSVWKYDVNAGPFPHAGSPTGPLSTFTIANFASKLVRGGASNYFYYSQNRSAGTDGPSIRVFNESGTEITNSLDASRTYLANPSAADILRNTTSIDLSPDGTTLALLRGTAFGTILLVPLTNGVFNFAAATNTVAIGANGASDNNRDIAYDAAGNLYVINTATEWFRIYSRGGATVATTGTDGTFVMGVPAALISATNTATANEEGLVNGTFNLTRSGNTSSSLTVNYTVSGTATPGADYTALPGSVTFLPGATSTNITVSVTQDAVAELSESVILTVTGSANYGVTGGPATVSILDNEPTEVALVLAQTETRLLEGYSHSKLTLRLTRLGLIAPALTVNLGYTGGTAANGADFGGPVAVAVGANVATLTTNLTSIDDELFEGQETLNASLLAGAGYAVNATNSASATVIDDDYPPGTVLFADNFEIDSSTNWVVNVNEADAAAEFAFDYSQFFIPPVPGGSSTKGLRFRLNELANAPANAISASPLGLNLQGDYRLRFKMWINYNGPMFDGGPGSTLHMTAGVGTTGDHANRATFALSDGIWFGVDGDGGSTFAVGDCNAYVAIDLQSDISGVYAAGTSDNPRSTGHPYYSSLWGGIGAPPLQLTNHPSQTGTSQAGNMGVSWHTVVITKATNVVTYSIDGIPIASVPADATPLSTNVFVGYQDLFPGAASVPAMSFAVVDNVRVETFATATPALSITRIQIVGGNVEITFAGPELLPGAFKLQKSAQVGSGYADDNTALITSLGSGTFKATTALSGGSQFYRVRY